MVICEAFSQIDSTLRVSCNLIHALYRLTWNTAVLLNMQLCVCVNFILDCGGVHVVVQGGQVCGEG